VVAPGFPGVPLVSIFVVGDGASSSAATADGKAASRAHAAQATTMVFGFVLMMEVAFGWNRSS
jgi:hypothetical protein